MILAGLVASLALPPIGFLVGILALSLPIYCAFDMLRSRSVFLLGWATGLGWFVFSLYWISNALVTSGGWHLLLLPFAGLGLPLFLGLFWGVAFYLAHLIAKALKLNRAASSAVMALGLTLFEYLRGHILTGFPWNAPGLLAAGYDFGLSWSSVTGYWGMSLVVLLISILPILIYLRSKVLLTGIAVMIIGIGIVAHQSLPANSSLQNDPSAGMQVRLVQPNIPQMDKWDRELRPKHLSQLVAASRHEAETPLDLIIWPETAFAGSYDREKNVFKAITQAATSGVTPVLTGVLRSQPIPFVLNNAAMLMAPDGGILGSSSKAHLVPFGEYAPWREYIPFVDAIAGAYDFSPGIEGQALIFKRQDGRQVRILPLICYEVIFPEAVRRNFKKAEAYLIVTITNDGWFGDSIGPRQHLAMAQMRSAELGRPMIRVANTGISAVINSHGQITHAVNYGEAGHIDAPITAGHDTIYMKYGELVFALLLLMFIALTGIEAVLTRSVKPE